MLALEWLLAAMCLFPGTLMPLARDQGHFAYTGQIILDGGVPYRDVFDQKGPATHYTFALILWAGGQTQVAIRGFFFLVALATTRLGAVLAERWAGVHARLPTVLCLGLVLLQGDGGAPWQTAQVEDLLLLLQLAVTVLWSGGITKATRTRDACGWILLGLSVLYKPTALVPCLSLAACAAWCRALPTCEQDAAGRVAARGSPIRWLVTGVAWFTLPLAIAAACLGARGALGDAWQVLVEFNAAYVLRRQGLASALLLLATRWGRLLLISSWGALGKCAVSAQAVGRFVWTSLLANFATVLWQGKFWPYHWTPAIGCLAILAGMGVARVVQELKERWSGRIQRPVARLAAPLVMAGLVLLAAPVDMRSLYELGRQTGRVVTGRLSLDEFRAPYECGAVQANVHQQVANYLRERTRPDETIVVWGYETVLHFLAQRRAPSRFAVDRILCVPEFSHRAAWRREFMQAVRRRAPAYIVVAEHNATTIWQDSRRELAEFAEFQALLARDYQSDRSFDRLHVYRRRSGLNFGLALHPPNAFGRGSRERTR